MENPANHLYATWPERLYVIDEQGEVGAWLEQRFGRL